MCKIGGRVLVAIGFVMTMHTGGAAAAPLTTGPDPGVFLLMPSDLPGWELLSSAHHEFVPDAIHPNEHDRSGRFRGPIDGQRPRPEVQVDASLFATAAQAQHAFTDSTTDHVQPPNAHHLQPPIVLPADLGEPAMAWHYASSATLTGFQVWILQGSVVLWLDSAGDAQAGASDSVIGFLASAQAHRARIADLSAPPFDWSATLADLPRPWDVALNASDVGDQWSAVHAYRAATQPPHADLTGCVDLACPDGAWVRSWVEAYESVDAAVHRFDSTLSIPAFPLMPMGDESEGVTSVDDSGSMRS